MSSELISSPGAASMPVQRVRESRVRDLIESDTRGEGSLSATRKACAHVAASRRNVMNLGRLGRAHALAAQQRCPPLGDKVIDVVDGEREHGRSLLVEFAARGALGEPLDRAVDAGPDGIELGKRPGLLDRGDHLAYPRQQSRLIL